jgi:Ca2+-transporting ATPase
MSSRLTSDPAVASEASVKQWYQLDVAEALNRLGTGAESGLTAGEVTRRSAAYGPNELQQTRRTSPWAVFLAQFKNTLILILLVAVGLSLLLGQTTEAITIGVIVLFAALLGFYQEFRAERALEALRDLAAPTAAAIRDGQESTVPARDLVPGDIILLRMGDKVPADARLIEAANLKLEEAALTGESLAVEKQTLAVSGQDLPLGDRTNMVYAGTAVVYGRGRAAVVATGMRTEFGRIAQFLGTLAATPTPLQQNLARVSEILALAALTIVVAIGALGLLRGLPLLNVVIFGLALAVAVVPESLPAVVTISLAIGVQRMARRNALVRRLPAVEALGSVSVICSDKTGTLTKDEMTVRKILIADELFTVSGAGYEPEGGFFREQQPVEPAGPLADLLRAAVLASDARLVRMAPGERADRASQTEWQVKGDPTEGALVVAAAKAGLHREVLDREQPRVAEVPFTSESKRMTTLHAGSDGLRAYAKGAPEVILRSCTQAVHGERLLALGTAERDAINESAQRMATEALRVLAVAYKPDATLEDAETDMILLGMVGMIDPPRPESKTAIATCGEAGIKPMMITGDHPSTAAAVARELGLLTDGRVITGAELARMSDADLQRDIDSLTLFARVSPADKLRVVGALQDRGHFVAMTGDGINDAPALKKANIGIAMGIKGTEVTREAADMTLTDDNFASIVAAVEEGRAVFANIKKYLMFLLSSNLGEIVLLAAASLLNWPLPLTAVQILYVNLATDGLPALALAVDPAEEDLMRRPPRDPRTGIFTRPVVALMMAGGLWSALINLSLFRFALASGHALSHAMTMVFAGLVLIELFKAYNFRSDRRSVFHRALDNRWLNRAVVWELALLLAVVYAPFFQTAFGTVALSTADWALITLTSLTIFPVLELAKSLGRRRWFGEIG